MIGHTLYLVRHGQTEDNAAEQLTGRRDSPLTSLGEAQAAANGLLLRELGAGRACDFVASPLGRARRTMELLRTAMELHPHDYRVDPRLMEADYGDYHGRHWLDAKAFRKAFVAGGGDAWQMSYPNGESRARFYARVSAFLGTIARDTVIVSHGGTVRMLRGALLGLGNDEIVAFDAPNAGVIEICSGSERLHGR